jgi:hypothetical protein
MEGGSRACPRALRLDDSGVRGISYEVGLHNMDSAVLFIEL